MTPKKRVVMGFKNNLKVEKIGDQDYILLDDLVYENNALIITVKSGFWFDAISIPKIFWTLIDSPFTGKAVRAATIHDGLYASQALPRADCDKIFLECMKCDGVSYFKRYAMYQAVRLGGRKAYENTEDLEHYKNLVKVVRK